MQTRLGDRSGHEPCPCRARTIPAPLALDADLIKMESEEIKYILFNISVNLKYILLT